MIINWIHWKCYKLYNYVCIHVLNFLDNCRCCMYLTVILIYCYCNEKPFNVDLWWFLFDRQPGHHWGAPLCVAARQGARDRDHAQWQRRDLVWALSGSYWGGHSSGTQWQLWRWRWLHIMHTRVDADAWRLSIFLLLAVLISVKQNTVIISLVLVILHYRFIQLVFVRLKTKFCCFHFQVTLTLYTLFPGGSIEVFYEDMCLF